jgi:diaminopimelate epimerase
MTPDRDLRFWKGQALGNDYIVVEDATSLTPAVIRVLCDRHRGVGGDGVLLGSPGHDIVSLRIFNPDGGEAEKSGNGLRIFAAWLDHLGLVGSEPFRVALPAEEVEMQVEGPAREGGRMVRVDMGMATFRARDVHFTGAPADAEVLGGTVVAGGETVAVHLVSMGNPHCVVFAGEADGPSAVDRATLLRLGPALQSLPEFSRGINVQLARVLDAGTAEAMVWERGVGETLASGSSACAVAAAAVRTGRLEPGRVEVRMPGGSLVVRVAGDWRTRLTGSAQIVYEGTVPGRVVAGWRAGSPAEGPGWPVGRQRPAGSGEPGGVSRLGADAGQEADGCDAEHGVG